MSLFRKEALEHRSRALFGEVVLRGSISSWIITALLALIMVVFIAGLYLLTVETDNGNMRLIDWILARGSQ